MNQTHVNATYKGFRTAGGWEVVVARPGQPLRLLDLPRHPGEWGLSILTDYLGDPERAAELSADFAEFTINRFTEDWVLGADDVENAIMEVEILRARWRKALLRG